MLKECEQKLAAARSPAAIADLELEKQGFNASIAVERRKQRRLLKQSEPLDARIEELGADISRLERQARAWHAYPFSLV